VAARERAGRRLALASAIVAAVAAVGCGGSAPVSAASSCRSYLRLAESPRHDAALRIAAEVRAPDAGSGSGAALDTACAQWPGLSLRQALLGDAAPSPDATTTTVVKARHGERVAIAVLAPVDGAASSSDVLDRAVSILIQRAKGLGASATSATRSGDTITVQVAAEDPRQVIASIARTGELRFRPVLGASDQQHATSPSADLGGSEVVLPERPATGQPGGWLRLGPALADGTIIAAASAATDGGGGWQIDFELTPTGSTAFDRIAARCYQASDAACPTGRLAIVVDSQVESAPTINAVSFGGRGQITGSFTEDEAKALALAVRTGSLPLVLQIQRIDVAP
jgi:preprotein translocase subunit SecD